MFSITSAADKWLLDQYLTKCSMSDILTGVSRVYGALEMRQEEVPQMNKDRIRETATSLSGTEYQIMSLLISNGEMYGLQMVEKAGGKLKKGTIYVLLGRLEEKGYVKARTELAEGSAIPRRLYRPTGHGQKVFEAHRPVAEIRGLRGAYV